MRGALPEPGEHAPTLAWPTVAIFFAMLAVWATATWGVISGSLPLWLTIPMHVLASFVMFTVAHDASHYSISTKRWVNALFGRLSMPFFVAYASWPMFGFIHIQHHRYANEEATVDPDHYTTEGPWWQLPFRWLTVDLWYGRYYFMNRKRRPTAEIRETQACMGLSVAAIVAAALTGTLWYLAFIYFVPQRITLGILAWWFDWLPHHGLEDTQRKNRYRATRVRVGLERLMTPIMLSQNYHLVHHLHPAIPFYRYLRTWRRNEEGYLQHEPALATVFGKTIHADEYRALRELDSSLARMLAIKVPEGTESPHATFHTLRVATVEYPTDDSVSLTFDVPDDLKPHFRWEPGQHIIVRSDKAGDDVRRNYSICSSAIDGELRIGVKHIPDGAFSTYAIERLQEGDEIEVMTPTGSFSPVLDPDRCVHYGAIAGGSGITPIISIIETALQVEANSTFTLVYANRTKASTMFRDELDELESRYADRLEVMHVLSREEQGDELLDGRLDEARFARLLEERLPADSVDEWFLCGPPELVETVHEGLIEADIDPARVQVELFLGQEAEGVEEAHAEVTFHLGGDEHSFELEGTTVLEGALGVRDDVPYACMSGACGTCRAKLVEGDVKMDHNYALKKDELKAGYVLTCQSFPTTDELVVDYDA